MGVTVDDDEEPHDSDDDNVDVSDDEWPFVRRILFWTGGVGEVLVVVGTTAADDDDDDDSTELIDILLFRSIGDLSQSISCLPFCRISSLCPLVLASTTQ